MISLIIITAISTSLFNYKKIKDENTYNNFVDNVYLKKTLNYVVDNLEPKFKKINHKVSPGETFDNILEQYSISKSEISEIKKKISKQDQNT